MYKKLTRVAMLLLTLTAITFTQTTALAAEDKATLYYGNGCPHCGAVETYLEENSIEIEQKEIYQDSKNAEEFTQICETENIALNECGVPFLYIEKGIYIIGDTPIIEYLESSEVSTPEVTKSKDTNMELTIPILIGAALTDAINPCAFAVLLILMTTILASGQKRRALFSGLAFSTSIFISYLLIGLGIYSVIASAETSGIFIKAIGSLAILLGLLNLKDFFWYGKGFLMEVPMSWRPKLKSLIHSITGPFGAFFIGFLVSLFLLPCTSGPYIVIIGMLGHKTTFTYALTLLVIYNLIFVLPMIGITIGTYFGMDVQKAEEKRGKNLKSLHLIAGLIMIGMGIALLLGFT